MIIPALLVYSKPAVCQIEKPKGSKRTRLETFSAFLYYGGISEKLVQTGFIALLLMGLGERVKRIVVESCWILICILFFLTLEISFQLVFYDLQRGYFRKRLDL